MDSMEMLVMTGLNYTGGVEVSSWEDDFALGTLILKNAWSQWLDSLEAWMLNCLLTIL